MIINYIMAKKKIKKKQKQKQKQKQSQSQKVIINLASQKRQTKKPRASATPNTARVLSQFIQPQQVLPDFRTMINPAPIPTPFMTQSQAPVISNAFAPRPSAVREGRILGSAPVETPLEVTNVMNSVASAERLLSGKKEPDNTSTQGRTLLPERFWTGRGVADAGMSGDETTAPAPFRQPRLRASSSTDATSALGRVDETDDEEGFGAAGTGLASPSLMPPSPSPLSMSSPSLMRR